MVNSTSASLSTPKNSKVDPSPVAKTLDKPTGGDIASRAGKVLAGRLDHSRWLRVAILASAVGVLIALVDSPLADTRFYYERYKGLLVGVMILVTAFFHLFLGHRDKVFNRNCRVLLVFGMIFGQLAIAKILQLWMVGYMDVDAGQVALFLPCALAPMVLSVLLGQRAGIYATLYGSLFTALVIDAGEPYLFIVLNLMSGLTAVAITGRVRKRGRLIRAGVLIGLVHLGLVWAFGLTTPLYFYGENIDWSRAFAESATIIGMEILVATLLSGMLPVLESFFGITTEISWIELADLNNPLLKRLTIEAPGTYHHSLLVGALSENAAERVGANATMARVCSYFHDIGKLNAPQYFIENQGDGVNPHDELTPHMSAKMILAHVPDGVALAEKHRLNARIVDVIREHHGTSMVYIFYRNAMKKREDQLAEVEQGMRAEEDVVTVDEADFRYLGPPPHSKESAIISLADAAESARRSLQTNDTKDIRELVDRLVTERIKDGQLDFADLTLQELSEIKKSFVSDLKSMAHARPSYRAEEPTFASEESRKRPASEAVNTPTPSKPSADEPAKSPAKS